MVLWIKTLSKFFSFKDFKVILAFCWSFFLTAGILYGSGNSLSILYLYLRSSFGSVSVFSLVLFRFVFLSAAVVFAHTGFRCGIAALLSVRGFSYGFLLGAVFSGFGSAGWLVCFLFNGTNVICTVVELWFCFSILNYSRVAGAHSIFIAGIFTAFAILMDIFLFSLVLSEVIVYY